MKRFLLAAVATSALFTSCASQTLPLVTQPRMTAPVSQLSRQSTVRSDEGLRKGVVELRKVRFQKWDTNISGFLTPDEVSDEQMALPGVITGFKDYDSNGDGKIYLEEFLREDTIQFWMGVIRPKLDELFSKHDLDGNRLITQNENAKLKLFFSPWPKLKGGDLNSDGVITFSEFEDAYMEILPFFQQTSEKQQTLPQF
ncbi:hypothetical protein COW36_01500 [bacterium (Candidatus Blackallbacteria) CG17_big_fil_post_rev_8_21_14_2_50_48_46]|uniref:EF-hand domain-containing protein n=1 Tax=bacterium (Candidatus Blackallbacteria) CG17_big_fil_post_rev_8_21_14_2_50_48_46 TaxID=2014261 RepID=A0A2M7GBH8_9BACT|nr:MAG: hypothetical protein COW64_09675 [bacterium (Candidatus Blackallbacteria) CG18_big_fil_WC_8_21_14_2_50_49_26]PIW19541.1 MAG: hypothetical protein COW36_01500 [bacterium (Candidatus Blackallbacteria) CG17_big_fil_post_rev_8_21_14_2_50_48_46]PIW48856.1 MAG: hypothetical protein COW20_06955 [bacterium (Candidatus Blackallbacteria) CG13_big_fil_rev_8_21_14_2_50_49_14]